MKKITSILLSCLFVLLATVPLIIQSTAASELENNNLYYIKNKRSNKFLTVDSSGNLVQADRNFTEYQRIMVTLSETVNGVNYYSLIPEYNSEYRITIMSGDADFSDVKSSPDANLQAQQFRFIDNGDESYKIMPRLSTTRVLDVENASLLDNAGIQLYPSRSDSLSDAQDWLLASAVKSINTWNLVDSGKHLDWDASNSNYEGYVTDAAAIWNNYKSDVIRKDTLLTTREVDIIDVADLGGYSGLTYPDGKIELNASHLANYSYYQIKNLLIHELGHALGMGHINGTNNVMYYTVNTCTELHDSNKNSYDLAYSNY